MGWQLIQAADQAEISIGLPLTSSKMPHNSVTTDEQWMFCPTLPDLTFKDYRNDVKACTYVSRDKRFAAHRLRILDCLALAVDKAIT